MACPSQEFGNSSALCLSCCCRPRGSGSVGRDVGTESCWTLHPRSLQRDPRLPSQSRAEQVHGEEAKPTGQLESRQTGQNPGCIRSCCDSGDILVSLQLTHQILRHCRVLRQSAQLAQRGETGSCRASESQPTKCKRQCGSVSCDGTDVNGRNTQNLATTLPNALVMLSCKCSDEIRPHHTQDVIRPGRGTM